MIAHVSGVIAEKFDSSVIVDVNGVGYEVQLATGDFDEANLNSEVKYYTYHQVREQSQELFGFSSLIAKRIFELLITVQGVGPKAAMSILSLGNSETIRNAIANADKVFIANASGIGNKTAERIIVYLSDKVGQATNAAEKNFESSNYVSKSDEALEALMALGYNLSDATKALEGISSDLSTSQRVTLALRGKK